MLDLLKELCWISLPHTNRPIFRLFLYPVLKIFSAPTRAATQGCPPSPQAKPRTALLIGHCQSTAGTTATAQRCRQLTCNTQGLVQLSISLLRATATGKCRGALCEGITSLCR